MQGASLPMPNIIQCLHRSARGGEAGRLAGDATAPTPDHQHSTDERPAAEAMTPAEATTPRTSHLLPTTSSATAHSFLFSWAPFWFVAGAVASAILTCCLESSVAALNLHLLPCAPALRTKPRHKGNKT
jgi:hypothetical protein